MRAAQVPHEFREDLKAAEDVLPDQPITSKEP